METLKRSSLSFTIANLVNKGILYFLITTGAWLEGEVGEVSPALSWKLEKSVLILRKSVLILVIFGLNFSFKMQFLSLPRRKNLKFFLFGLSSFSFWWKVFQSAIIQRKLPCSNSRLCACTIMTYYELLYKRINSRFFSRALWKNHENAKFLDF